jgi:hypothetical protein
MTEFFDVEEAIQSLGIGEALVTVLSPRGVPTPLAPTRLLPPDSLMAALDPAVFSKAVAGSALTAKYGTRLDPQSAHEIISARIAAARAAVVAPQGAAPAAAGADTGVLTPAEQRREIQRQVREQEQIRKQAEREAREIDRERRAAAREQAAAERAQQRERDSIIRAGSRVLTSRTGQQALRGLFGTLFGGSRRR